MISQSQLINRFYDGDYSGVASNMEIAETVADGHALIGYGHAVYAYRPPDDRFGPVCFVGWKGASKSTNLHIEAIRHRAEHELDGRARKSDIQDDPDLAYLEQIESDDKNYSTSHHRRESVM